MMNFAVTRAGMFIASLDLQIFIDPPAASGRGAK